MTPFAQWAKNKPERQLPSFHVSLGRESSTGISIITSGLEHSIAATEQLLELQKRNDWHTKWAKHQEKSQELKFRQKIDEIESKLSNSASSAIAPLLAESFVKNGIAEFCAIVKKHASAAAQIGISVESPDEWQNELQSRLTEVQLEANIVKSTCGEIRCQVGTTEIETDLHRWVTQIRETALA